MTCSNIILMSFSSSLLESDSNTSTQVRQNLRFRAALSVLIACCASTWILRASVNIRFWTVELRLQEKNEF